MNARAVTHEGAVDGVMLAMLSHAATINRPAVVRAIDAAANYLRALEPAVMLYAGDDDDEGRAVAAVVSSACDAMHDATTGDGREPLGDHVLSAALVTLVCGMGPELGAIIAEQAMPGELTADAARVEALRAMVATRGGRG